MSTLPLSRQDVRREFLSRLCATVQIDDSIVVDEPPSGTSSRTSDGTSRSTERDHRLDLLLGLPSSVSSSVSASSMSCNDHISTFPSMCIFSSSPPRSLSPTSARQHQEVQDSASAKHFASTSLSQPVAYKREEVASAPERLARSVTSSYSSLIQSNISAVTRKLNIRREALPPIRIATVSTSFVEDFSNCGSDNGPQGKIAQYDGASTTKIRLDIDFLLSIDNALATFSASATGSLRCYFSDDKLDACNYIDSVDLTINGHQLLHSLRKQARVAALFALMAAASANGGAIGGNGGNNGIHQGRANDNVHVDDARPQPQPLRRQEHVAGAAEIDLRALRCVSPEPIQYEDTKIPSCENSSESEARSRTEVGPLKRRRLDP